ncbi:MAG: hypothetical protein FWC92_01665 [Defluviitaleaceae bacterium]|nr:hypothetical protein [Defluviitaleaceae bacterium]
MKHITRKQIVSWAGTILMIVSLAFLAYRIYVLSTGADFNFSTFASAGVVVGLVLVALMEGLGILLAGFNFRALIKNVSGVLVHRPLALLVYTISNVYKYIPGGAMYVLGRNRLAEEIDDLSHPAVALSTIIEGALVAIAAILIVVVTVFDHTVEHIRQTETELPTAFVIVIIVVLVLAGSAVYSFRRVIAEGLGKLLAHMQVLRPLVLLKRFGFALLIMILWGGTFLATLVVLGQEMSPGMAPTIIGLFLLAWLAGFLTPGAPSGLGIREMIMLTFLSGMIYEGILIPAMVVHRVLAALGDVAAYGVAVAYTHMAKMYEKSNT